VFVTWARCCTPEVMSDFSWRHARDCPRTPLKKLTALEELDFKTRGLPTREQLASTARHPSGRHLHSVKDSDYIDAHSDDEDDDGSHSL
jgi:hypothetical protein